MKTGLGLFRKYRMLYAYLNLFRFWLRKKLLGFDVANQFIQRMDKVSLQLILKKNGATIGRNCNIETGLIFDNCRDYENLIIGNTSHIGKSCFFDLRDKVIVGSNVVISMQCSFITHIDMNKSSLKMQFPATQVSITINDNSYIGSGSQILKGVTIEKNGFVAAKALVTNNVPKNTIVGGVPAKVIKIIENN